jgi:protoheme IX farnesyltransferase
MLDLGWLPWQSQQRALRPAQMGTSRALAAALAVKEWCGDLAELAKARLMAMVLLTTLVGFYLGKEHPTEGWKAWHLLIGTGLVAASAAGLNQILEKDVDRRMVRTATRPLPAGRLSLNHALGIALVEGMGGLWYLGATLGAGPMVVAALTLVLYVVLYTPMKRKTPWHTLVGAVAGALPPVIGYMAGDRGQASVASFLFGILFLWQLPHFLAIAWLHRKEYEEAGIRTLIEKDPEGRLCAAACVGFAVALWILTLLAPALGGFGGLYLSGALFFGALFVGLAIRFFQDRTDAGARSLFVASIVYLPLLLALLVLDYRRPPVP